MLPVVRHFTSFYTCVELVAPNHYQIFIDVLTEGNVECIKLSAALKDSVERESFIGFCVNTIRSF